MAGFVALVAVAAGIGEQEAAKIVAIIMAGAVVIGYVIGEGLVDSTNKE